MDILGQSSLLVAVTSFALGMSVLAKNARNTLTIAFSVLTTLISFWALSFFLEKLWPVETFYWWHLFFNLWVGPAGLYFIRVFLRSEDAFSRRLLDLSLIVAFLLSIALFLHLEDTPWIRLGVFFSPILVAVRILWQMVAEKRTRRLARARWIYFGGLAALCTSTLDHVPELGKVMPSMGNLLLTVFIFFLSQAITQQRLLNFGALLSRFLVLLGVSLILTGMYSLLVAWISDSPELFFLNSFIASFFILTLLDPIRALVGYLTDRLLGQKHHKLKGLLREAQRKLTGTIDGITLFQHVVQFTQQTLQPQRVAVFILRPDGTKFRRVRSVGEEAGDSEEVREILGDHILIQACLRRRKRGELPILLDQLLDTEIERSASKLTREELAALGQGLRALGANLLIPLMDGQRVLGFVAVGAPSPPEAWGSNWGLLGTIFPYFEQAARTLLSLEIYAKAKEKDRLAALGEMAAGLAHEIRNPLGAIRGAAQLLDPSTDRPDSQFLRIIIEEVDRLNRVVKQFLDYSKPALAELKEVSLTELVEKTLEHLKPILPERVRVRVRREGAPVRIEGSKEQLQQVLINLIQNSIQALEDVTNAEITISVHGDREAHLVVEDNGRGIKREHMEKLFIPFFTTSPSGTGLGLPISQKIVEAHGGRIDASSEEGRHTRFTLSFPLFVPEGMK